MSADAFAPEPLSPGWFTEVGRVALTQLVGPEIVRESTIDARILPSENEGLDVVLEISTPDRPRLLAQYVPFEEDSYNGFALPFVRGWFASELFRMKEAPTIRLHLDVRQTTMNPRDEIPRCICHSRPELVT